MKQLKYADHAHIVHDGQGWATVKSALSKSQYLRHLSGDARYGVPLVKQGTGSTMMAMIDIDDHDGTAGWEKVSRWASQILDVLDDVGLQGNCYRSGGGNGINIWIMFDSPQAAAKVREAIRVPLLVQLGLSNGAGGINKMEVEIFPKQNHVAADEGGSCASLPRVPLDVWDWCDLEVGSVEFEMSDPVTDDDGMKYIEPEGKCNSELVVVEANQIDDMLSHIPNDDLDYDEWFKIVMAIKASGGTIEQAEAWSAKSSKYVEGYLGRKWKSIKNNKQNIVTVGTLRHHAESNGWSSVQADIELFPTNGEVLVEYARVPGKGRYAGWKVTNVDQLCRCVESDPDFPYKVCFDEFLQEKLLVRGDDVERLEDWHMVEMRAWFDRNYWEPVGSNLIRDVIENVAKRRRCNIARKWLDDLRWDGVDRYTEFVKRMGADVCDYYVSVVRYLMTSHAARIIEPGYQADAFALLISETQGLGKTQAFKALAPTIMGFGTYRDIHLNHLLEEDKAARALRGCLIANLDEMRNFSKREAAEIKAAISRTHESYVPKYRESREHFGRSCMLYGTNNEYEFLTDPTGNRRYHPIEVGVIDLEWIKENRDQLWAQGRDDFQASGQAWKRALELAPQHIERHTIENPWECKVSEYLGTVVANYVTTSEVLTNALNIPSERQTMSAIKMVAATLRSLGYERKVIRTDGRQFKAFAKPFSLV